MAVAAGLLLLSAGAVPTKIWLALVFAAFPGVVGAFWRPQGEERFGLLLIWTLGAILAVSVSGGLAGSLGMLCIMPVLACLTVGASWGAGLGLALTAMLVCAALGRLHVTATSLLEPMRTLLLLIGFMAVVLAGGGALLVARRRSQAALDAAEGELAEFQALMSDLPDFALAMDGEGHTQALFGAPLEGLDKEALHEGLIQAAALSSRPKLQSAFDAALREGSTQASFTSITEPAQLFIASLRRTQVGGVTAIVREAPPGVPLQSPTQAPPSVPVAPVPMAIAPVAAAAAAFALPATAIIARLNAAEAGRKAAEDDRDKALAAAAARGSFLANMSHELRTPLNAIMGFSDMMRAKMFGEMAPKYAEYAELIHESGEHLLALINDVLDMSKIEAQRYVLSREVFDVREALNGAMRLVRLQADEAGVKLRAVLPESPLMIDADKRAIKQIALNLLSNALKFTPKDGTVILSARGVDHDLELVVADTGTGIAAADLKRLGQPFEQAGETEDRGRGTGLGLSLVDAFAKLHGGTMTLESRLGEGTAATVRMPVLAPPTATVADPGETPVAEAAAEASPMLEAAHPQSTPGEHPLAKAALAIPAVAALAVAAPAFAEHALGESAHAEPALAEPPVVDAEAPETPSIDHAVVEPAPLEPEAVESEASDLNHDLSKTAPFEQGPSEPETVQHPALETPLAAGIAEEVLTDQPPLEAEAVEPPPIAHSGIEHAPTEAVAAEPVSMEPAEIIQPVTPALEPVPPAEAALKTPPASPDLGPLDTRAQAHQGLRQTLLVLFGLSGRK